MDITVNLSGPFHVCGGLSDGAAQQLQTHRMAQQLLAFLLLMNGRAVSREELARTLWEGGTTINNLNRTVQVLRSVLESGGTSFVETTGAIGLKRDGFHSDVVDFYRVFDVRPLDIKALMSCVERCEQPLLQGWDEDWVIKERARFADKYRYALTVLAQTALRGSNTQLAQRFLARLRMSGDVAEDLHVALLEEFFRRGAYPSAKQFYLDYQRDLRELLHVKPSHRMMELYNALPDDAAEFEAPVEAHNIELEPPGGSMPVGSRFYVARKSDTDFHTALARQDGTILINGPRQVGKSSLLARGVEQALRADMRVVTTDFQALDTTSLETLNSFYRALTRQIHRKLVLPGRAADAWDANLPDNENFSNYLEDVVLAPTETPFVWCIDEADRIFDRSYRADVFGLFRSWINARQLDRDSKWRRLLLVLAYSTEASLFIPNINMSPFNVGTKIPMADLDIDQLAALNAIHGAPLSVPEGIDKLYRLVGGHPYLVRLCLYEAAVHQLTISDMVREDQQESGLFGEHLRRLYSGVSADADLTEGLKGLLQGKCEMSQMVFVRLRSAGIVDGGSAATARIRCGLYAGYFGRRLC